LALLEQLGLPFGTIDMRIDPCGEYQFLEVNPAGQFLWIEIATGLPISAAVADLLQSVTPHHRANRDRPLR
jgi:D-alanine-D-alanine ligase-like ATP-grasp enzyme